MDPFLQVDPPLVPEVFLHRASLMSFRGWGGEAIRTGHVVERGCISL